MRTRTGITLASGLLLTGGALLLPAFTKGQPPANVRGAAGRQNRGGAAQSGGADAFIARLMAFDKNKDGKISKDEMTDERLRDLFDRADTNKDGVVTKEELAALYARESASLPSGGNGGPPDGGPGGPGGGFGGPGGPPPEGFGPRGRGFGGPPAPGQILPVFMQQQLRLTDAQKKQISELQKEVDARLDKILTAEQKNQWKAMQNRRPGGPGGFGPGGPGRGPGGPGGPGGRGGDGL